VHYNVHSVAFERPAGRRTNMLMHDICWFEHIDSAFVVLRLRKIIWNSMNFDEGLELEEGYKVVLFLFQGMKSAEQV
jgi:hypothetical protein